MDLINGSTGAPGERPEPQVLSESTPIPSPLPLDLANPSPSRWYRNWNFWNSIVAVGALVVSAGAVKISLDQGDSQEIQFQQTQYTADNDFEAKIIESIRSLPPDDALAFLRPYLLMEKGPRFDRVKFIEEEVLFDKRLAQKHRELLIANQKLLPALTDNTSVPGSRLPLYADVRTKIGILREEIRALQRHRALISARRSEVIGTPPAWQGRKDMDSKR